MDDNGLHTLYALSEITNSIDRHSIGIEPDITVSIHDYGRKGYIVIILEQL